MKEKVRRRGTFSHKKTKKKTKTGTFYRTCLSHISRPSVKTSEVVLPLHCATLIGWRPDIKFRSAPLAATGCCASPCRVCPSSCRTRIAQPAAKTELVPRGRNLQEALRSVHPVPVQHEGKETPAAVCGEV